MPFVTGTSLESENLRKMKARKAKRGTAKSSSGYTVEGVKEDYDLDKVLADLGEEKSKPKGQKAAGGSGSSLKKKSSSQVSKTRADSTEEQAATPATSSQQQQQQVCSLTQFSSAEPAMPTLYQWSVLFFSTFRRLRTNESLRN